MPIFEDIMKEAKPPKKRQIKRHDFSKKPSFTDPKDKIVAQSPTLNVGFYWWVVGRIETGQSLLLGPYGSEDEARQIGYEKLNGDFTPVQLRTRDRGTATQILRHRKLTLDDQSISESMKDVRHRGRGTPIE